MGFVAVREAERYRRIGDPMVLQIRDELALFAGEKRLCVDRFVKGLLDLAEGVVEHALVGGVRIHQERVQIVEARDAWSGLDDDLGRLAGSLVR
jgi:hypothetical protein